MINAEKKNGRTCTAAKGKSEMEHRMVLKAADLKAGVAIAIYGDLDGRLPIHQNRFFRKYRSRKFGSAISRRACPSCQR